MLTGERMTFRFLLERVSIVGALTLGFPAEVGWGPATAAAAAARGLCCVSSGQDAAAAAYVGCCVRQKLAVTGCC